MMWIRFALICVLAAAVSGCATGRKSTVNAQVEGLETRVSELESQVQEKSDRIKELEGALSASKAVAYETSVAPVSAGKMTVKEIQIALKNAGYYDGTIDGKIGPRTKKAIKEFQKANGLMSDGVVGRQTRAKLRAYLSGE